MARNSEQSSPPAAVGDAPDRESGGGGRCYTIDIRVFLVTITTAMLVSFLAGIGLGDFPPLPENVLAQSAAYSSASTVRDAFMDTDPAAAAAKKAADLLHHPSGQHLLCDMEGVDAEFLNSEERLSAAMVETVKEAGLTLLSYHCHSLQPSGVSCVGVLMESHVSFHTWPSNGVITLDLFTCGNKPLLPVISVIERLFGIGDNVRMQWSHELRGFRSEEEKKKHYLDDSSDLSLWVLSPLEMYSKTQIYSNMTKFQRVDIWDIVELTDTPTYQDVLKYNLSAGDPRLSTPELATPDRLLFLDGTIQSIGNTENIYHEAMVHPAMFAHARPKQVAILGGGEGATLREVLKHKTVDRVTMIELDEELVALSRQYLPNMSNCSDLLERSENCFDDPLADVQFADGRQWFIDRYGENAVAKEEPPTKFDVILIDALDPEDSMEVAEKLYNDENFITALMNSLTEEGVITIQVGTAATIDDPRADAGIYRNREILFNMLETNSDVTTLLVYEEPHCGFLEPHAFLLVCKSAKCRSRWYARSDAVDYEIYDRIVRTHSKKRALTYFDGTTQRSYQWPKRGWETVYCRREPMPFECAYRSLDGKADFHEYDLENEEAGSFRVEVKMDEKNETEWTKTFALKPIKKGSYIMGEHLASSLQVTTRNLDGLKNNVKVGGGRVAIIEDLLAFFDDFAHESDMEGSDQHYVEVGASCLLRRTEDPGEANVGKWIPPHPSGKKPKYSPVYERHRMSFDVFLVATKDIAVGEEVVVAESAWKSSI